MATRDADEFVIVGQKKREAKSAFVDTLKRGHCRKRFSGDSGVEMARMYGVQGGCGWVKKGGVCEVFFGGAA